MARPCISLANLHGRCDRRWGNLILQLNYALADPKPWRAEIVREHLEALNTAVADFLARMADEVKP